MNDKLFYIGLFILLSIVGDIAGRYVQSEYIHDVVTAEVLTLRKSIERNSCFHLELPPSEEY